MITGTIFVDVLVRHRLAGDPGDKVKRLQNRYRVFAPAPEIVNLNAPRLADKVTYEPDHIERMNIISNLFPFVTKDLVGFFLEIALDKITEKSVQLDPEWFGPVEQPPRRQQVGIWK